MWGFKVKAPVMLIKWVFAWYKEVKLPTTEFNLSSLYALVRRAPFVMILNNHKSSCVDGVFESRDLQKHSLDSASERGSAPLLSSGSARLVSSAFEPYSGINPWQKKSYYEPHCESARKLQVNGQSANTIRAYSRSNITSQRKYGSQPVTLPLAHM